MDKQRWHLLGICGAGMSGIAVHALARGIDVTGCDPSKKIPAGLDAATIFEGHDAQHVTNVDIVGASTAVKDNDVEIVAAKNAGLPVWRREKLLAEITKGKQVVSVSGTHGKTTTSAMVAHILQTCQFSPSYLIGANIPSLGGYARAQNGEQFVLEADESDASFLGPKTSVAVVTNIEPDHLDFYGSYDKLKEAFASFVTKAENGIVCADSPDAVTLFQLPNVTTYGVNSSANAVISDVVLSADGARATITIDNATKVSLELRVTGMHSVLNATAAVLAAQRVGVPIDDASKALVNFANAERRFTFRGVMREVTFIDDYAHLPTEVKTVLATARLSESKRVVAVFQPHRFSRTANVWQEFAGAFADADLVIITDIYAAGEPPQPGISGKLIVDAIMNQNPNCQIAYLPERDVLRRYLTDRLRPGDLVVTMGAGDITLLAEELQEEWRATTN